MRRVRGLRGLRCKVRDVRDVRERHGQDEKEGACGLPVQGLLREIYGSVSDAGARAGDPGRCGAGLST